MKWKLSERFLFESGFPSKSPERLRARLVDAQAARSEIPRFHIDVKAHLVIHVALESAAAKPLADAGQCLDYRH
jgi:hypothetical protein